MKVGINGMGRIGRLALRAAMGAAERQSDDPRSGNRLEVVHLNEIKGGAATTAHLLAFDSVQGKWRADIRADGEQALSIDDKKLGFSAHAAAADIPWGDLGVDLVLECTGKFLTPETLQGHLDRGAKRVIVAAPVKVGGVLNIVHHEIPLICSAESIPETIEIDLTGLDIGDAIHIDDIKLPEGTSLATTERDFTVATIAVPSAGVEDAEVVAEGEGE